jgi:hypothetical protein
MRDRILNALSDWAPLFLPVIFLISAILWAVLIAKIGSDVVSVVVTGDVTPTSATHIEGRKE